MKKTVKTLALVCAVVMLASLLSGCSVVDSGKLLAVETLVKVGQYETAYKLLMDLEGEDAEEWKEKLVFVPLSRVQTDEFGFEDSRATYVYDEKMYPMVQTYEDGEDTTRYTYSYDQDGNLLTYRSAYGTADSTSWSQSVATYDQDGNLLTLVNTDSSDSSKCTYTYTYDQRGNCLTKVREYYSEEQVYDEWWTESDNPVVAKTETTRYTYTYDENDNLLSSYWVDDEGQWSKNVYTYDADGNELACQNEYYAYDEDEDGRKVWDTTRWTRKSTYDADGNTLTYKVEESDGTGYQSTYTYDADGNVLTYRSEDSEEGWEQRTYTYDADGNVLTYQHSEENGYWYKSIFTYDKRGNRLTENNTTSSGSWSKSTYEYDKEDNCIRETNTNSDGEQEEYRYTYDEFGNHLTMERWEDGSVDYKYEYEWQLVYYENGCPATYLEDMSY